jgi:hypothetical protein
MMLKIPAWITAVIVLAAVAVTAFSVHAATASQPPAPRTGISGIPSAKASPDAHPPRSFTVTTPVTSLDVTADVAAITVTGSQHGTTSVTVTTRYSPSPPVITHTVTGGALQVGETCPSGNGSCDVSIAIQVPRDVTAQVDDADGNVTMSGLTGTVTATSDTGTIALSGISGPVTATNSDGDIDGTALTSRGLTLRDDTGDITVSLLTPPSSLRATNSDGDVTIGLPSSVSYRISTPNSQGLASVSVAVPASKSSPYSVTASSDTGSVSIVPGSANA